MVGYVKVLNLQTLGPAKAKLWQPFFVNLAKWMDQQQVSPDNKQAQSDLFKRVGEALVAVKKENKPVAIAADPKKGQQPGPLAFPTGGT
jgi:hypothetical protein